MLCRVETDASYNLQRYFLMLLLAVETISRTCIATILYLVATVSVREHKRLNIDTIGMGHRTIQLRTTGRNQRSQVARRRLHRTQCILHYCWDIGRTYRPQGKFHTRG